MVSALSARLLGNSGDISICGSNSSSRRGGGGDSSVRSKRTRPDTSSSGYSADKEEPSVSPPLNSIDLFSVSRTSNPREANNCPKRRKRNELEFAATSVKADLARAGTDFRKIQQNKKETSCLGDVTINLKGVELVFSNQVDKPLVSSNVSATTTSIDFQSLALACWDAYPTLEAIEETRMKTDIAAVSKAVSSAFSQDQDQESSDRSTSSVSDTESDSVESSGNGTSTSKGGTSSSTKTSTSDKVLFIPPNLDDYLKKGKQSKRITLAEPGRPCNIIVSPSNSVTLDQVLELSKTAR